uniref:Uncharacterized protein n=1 Tax=Sphaerodactylus townsendi TaxID=933632 RepID=A0ACB8EPG1_9SAUR
MVSVVPMNLEKRGLVFKLGRLLKLRTSTRCLSESVQEDQIAGRNGEKSVWDANSAKHGAMSPLLRVQRVWMDVPSTSLQNKLNIRGKLRSAGGTRTVPV